MGQVLHIFGKDTRRFWPEILVVLAVLVGFAFLTPSTWDLMPMSNKERLLQMLAGAMKVLVPLSWWLLLARVVQAESLVGENQAWLTRPYDWYSLLAAKALFVVTYLSVPLLVAQCVLLKWAGFAPLHFAGGLAYDGVLVALVLVLPLFAVAALTANFARMTLTLLGLLLSAIGLAALGLYASGEGTPVIQYTPDHGSWLLLAWMALLLGVLILQYRTRRTWLARGLLMLPTLVFVLVAMLNHEHADVEANYPATHPGETAAVVATYAPQNRDVLHATPTNDKPDQIELTLPVDFSDIPAGFAVEMNMERAVIDAPGVHWESKWQGDMRRYAQGIHHSGLYFRMDRKVYEQLRGRPVDLRIEFAMGQLKAERSVQETIAQEDFALGDRGLCSAKPNVSSLVNLACRFALRQPDLTYITGEVRGATCAAPDATVPHLLGDRWQGGLSLAPADLSISPVEAQEVQLTARTDAGTEFSTLDHTRLRVCPGTVVTLMKYKFDRRRREEMEIKGFVLPVLATEQ